MFTEYAIKYVSKNFRVYSLCKYIFKKVYILQIKQFKHQKALISLRLERT